MPEWSMQLVQMFGPFGFIMYLVWKFQSHTIPKLTESNQLAQDQQREDFKEILDLQLRKFEEMQKAQMDFFQKALEREQALYAKQSEEIVAAIKEIRG